WTIYPLPLDNTESVPFGRIPESNPRQDRPAFYRGEFTVDTLADTFVNLDGWSKGVVWINGFNLGRYWDQGPQRTLYLPAPLLCEGTNEIIILELHHTENPSIELTDTPDLG